ncbi:hypothetical protein HK102_000979 [Quaeritorhiza haematococci]|nr:hypothetical protein HK102_000979 [Quaeritorhiza haematococci]
MKNKYIALEAVLLHKSPPDRYAPNDEPFLPEKYCQCMREMLMEDVDEFDEWDTRSLVTDLEDFEVAIDGGGAIVNGSTVMEQGGERVLEGGGLEEYVCSSMEAGSGLWRTGKLLVPNPWAKTGF